MTHPIQHDRLRSIVDRIERLEAEKDERTDGIKDIYQEAKSAGFDVKVIRALIKERSKDPADVAELATLLDVYRSALAFDRTQLAEAAQLRAVA